MTANSQFDGIGNHLSRHQRRPHARCAHGNAIGYHNGIEINRRTSRCLDALAQRRCQRSQVHVAGCDIAPGVDDGNQGLFELPVGQTGCPQHGACGCSFMAVTECVRHDRSAPGRCDATRARVVGSVIMRTEFRRHADVDVQRCPDLIGVGLLKRPLVSWVIGLFGFRLLHGSVLVHGKKKTPLFRERGSGIHLYSFYRITLPRPRSNNHKDNHQADH